MAPRLEAVGIELRWEVGGTVPELPSLDAARCLHLLRLVQEALNNAVRHSGAKTVLLRVEGVPDRVTVIVRDDGRGFDKERVEGRGMTHMRQRARQLNGTLHWFPGPNGVEVRLELPVSR